MAEAPAKGARVAVAAVGVAAVGAEAGFPMEGGRWRTGAVAGRATVSVAKGSPSDAGAGAGSGLKAGLVPARPSLGAGGSDGFAPDAGGSCGFGAGGGVGSVLMG